MTRGTQEDTTGRGPLFTVVVWAAAAVVVIGVVAVLGVLIDRELLLDVDGWAALGQWVGGLAGAGAIVAALAMARRDRGLVDADAARARIAQAHLITADVVKGDDGVVFVEVVNHGPQAVVQVVVPRLFNRDRSRTITAGEDGHAPPRTPMIAPGARWRPRPPTSGRPGAHDVGLYAATGADPDRIAAEVCWVDLHGTCWHRVGNGEPRKLDGPDGWRHLDLGETVRRDAELARYEPPR